MPSHIKTVGYIEGITEMTKNAFKALEEHQAYAFLEDTGVDDVQVYFCHHVLSLVVFGRNCRAHIHSPEEGWLLRLQTSEDRRIPFSNVIDIPLLGIELKAVSKALERLFEEDVRSAKVQLKEIYKGAKRESHQHFYKDTLMIELLNPNTKETLHCFWLGQDFHPRGN